MAPTLSALLEPFSQSATPRFDTAAIVEGESGTV